MTQGQGPGGPRHKRADTVKVPMPRQPTAWLTRDSDANGVLSDEVRIWLDRPERFRDSMGVYWACRTAESLWCKGGLEWARYWFRTIPDDDRQLIRNGEDKP